MSFAWGTEFLGPVRVGSYLEKFYLYLYVFFIL